MRLRVDPRDGAVKLVLPRRASLADAARWAETKRGWVESQLEKLPAMQPVGAGMAVPFAGRELTLDWSPRHPRAPSVDGNALCIGGPPERLSPRLLAWLRKEARTLLAAESREMAERIGARIGDVGVGDPVSRWGSCTANGNIRYSWRLILAPAFVRRATVAHEVAHLVHLNHGQAFHALVAELFESDPSPARRWLREHGAALHWFGRDR